jgi:hypothetical protein
MREFMRIVESQDAENIGMIVRAMKGDDFDEVTHFYVRCTDGFRRINQLSPRQFSLMPERVETLNGYDTVTTVVPAPKPGERLLTSIQMIGFPEGTEFLSLSGKIITMDGDLARFEGKLYDLKYVEEVSRA